MRPRLFPSRVFPSRARKQAIAALLFLAASPVWSWGPSGHRIVAIIAEQRLSPQAREKIHKLLLDGKYSIVDISSCADQIRGNPRGNPTPADVMCRSLAGQVPSTNGLWHYIDIPVPTKAKTLEAFCKEDNCVTARINSFSEILRTSKDDAKRRQALLFLVHFVGDIHQPLHAAERACDHGGNSEHVNFSLDGQKESNVALHHVWDSSELELLMKHENITDDRVFAGILMAGIKPAEAGKWARASADQMAWESYKLAVSKVYRGIPFQNFCDNQKPAPLVTDLTAAYENDGTKVVREQLMKAGVRLAAILEADLNQ
jgi:nuclease S1